MLHQNQSFLDHFSLPNIGYPVSLSTAKPAMPTENEMPLATLLFGLQQFNEDGDANNLLVTN
jgi:hypothetical protein